MTEQSRYQVRFEWGAAGGAAIWDDAEIVAVVDTLHDAQFDISGVHDGAAVIETDLRTASAAARWISELQRRLAHRVTIAVVAAGGLRSDGSMRQSVEDHLAAGALIDAMVSLGIDATSPEAAIAENAYRGLARAATHLISASTGKALAEIPKLDPALGPEDVTVLRRHPSSG